VLELHAELTATGSKTIPVIIDYVVHYVKANGATSAKVFKWAETKLTPGTLLALTKLQQIRDFTTRKHHAGRHRIELQVNGRRIAETAFRLTLTVKK